MLHMIILVLFYVVLQSYCSKNMDLWWEMLVSVLFIKEDEEQIETSWMKFWLVINPPSWMINKCCFSSRAYTIGLFIILIILILQEWLSATHFFFSIISMLNCDLKMNALLTVLPRKNVLIYNAKFIIIRYIYTADSPKLMCDTIFTCMN